MACEADLMMGYIFFFRVDAGVPVSLSFTLFRSLIHRGLKVRNDQGNLIPAFPQTPQGAAMAGELIIEYIQSGGAYVDLWNKCQEAFSDWFKKPDDNAEKKTPETEPTSKN
jgi:hypothetical protein